MITSLRARGFTLVEVTIALGIAVFCLVVIFGLLTVGVNTSAISVEQTTATTLPATVASDLRTAPNTFPYGSVDATSTIYKLSIPKAVAAPATPTVVPGPTPAVIGPQIIYLDSNGVKIPANYSSSLPNTTLPTLKDNKSNLRYQLNVWTRPGVGREPTMARLMLSWPPLVDLTKNNPAGSVETLVALDRN